MNFLSVKKNVLSLLALSCLFAQSMMVSGRNNAAFKEEERAYVHKLANEIEDMFEFFRVNISKFIDPCDHTPYRQLAVALSDKIAEFEQHVMTTLAKKLVEAKSKNTEVFQQSICIVQEVLTDFLTKLNVLRNILVKPEYLNAHDGIQAIKLAKELEKYCKDLLDGKIIAQLEAKIDTVYNLVSGVSEQSLSERLKEIKNILKNLKGASMQKKSGSELKVVNGITAKIRHNK